MLSHAIVYLKFLNQNKRRAKYSLHHYDVLNSLEKKQENRFVVGGGGGGGSRHAT